MLVNKHQSCRHQKLEYMKLEKIFFLKSTKNQKGQNYCYHLSFPFLHYKAELMRNLAVFTLVTMNNSSSICHMTTTLFSKFFFVQQTHLINTFNIKFPAIYLLVASRAFLGQRVFKSPLSGLTVVCCRRLGCFEDQASLLRTTQIKVIVIGRNTQNINKMRICQNPFQTTVCSNEKQFLKL